jgi:uncharacterized Fe-S cluster-containing radical SAM superfamily protein
VILRDRQDVNASGLQFLWLEITEKCNLQCIHCYADSAPDRPLLGSMELSDWIKVIDEASDLGCSRLQFIGGEPTIHPGLGTLIEHARNSGFEFIEIYTNGTHFKPTLRESFIHNKVHLAFSVYSNIPAVHDCITRVSGSFFKTMNSIQWALDVGLNVRIGIIEMEANAGHAGSTKEMLAKIGVTDFGVDRMRGIGRGARKGADEQAFGELCGQCWRGRLCVTATGKTFPCVFSRFCPIGSARGSLTSLLQTEELRRFRAAVRRQQEDLLALGETCEPFSPPVCKPDRTVCNPDLAETCEPFSPPVCKPDRPVCNPDLLSPPSPCTPNTPCSPDCAPNACTPQIA